MDETPDPHYCELTCVSEDSGPDERTPKGLFACRLEGVVILKRSFSKLNYENLRRWRVFCDALETEARVLASFSGKRLTWNGLHLQLDGVAAQLGYPGEAGTIRECLHDANALVSQIQDYWTARIRYASSLADELAGDPIPF